ncbi:MAG: hypothetical protein OQJ81_13015 [Melioribacteraceae bacterium]|nr:hypothetical protein [Melioribacteraceae bacterium]
MIVIKKVKYSIIFIFISCFFTYAQVNVLQVPDTTYSMENNNYKIRLNNIEKGFSPLFKMKQQIADFNNFEFYFPNIDPPSLGQSVSMFHLRNEINQTMNIYRQGQNKYHLGVVSEILGYASGAAALGLAAYHVSKYKKYYGIK